MSAANRTQLWHFGALALFCGVPLLLAALTIGNLVEAFAARAVATRQNATAAQIIKQVAERQARRAQPQDTSLLFLAATSASLARAELQERAGHFVEAAGGHLEEAQFTSTPEQEADGIVAIQLSLTIDNNGLRDLLYAVETAAPLLEATDLTAKPINAQAAEVEGQAHLLHVDLTIEGQLKKGTG